MDRGSERFSVERRVLLTSIVALAKRDVGGSPFRGSGGNNTPVTNGIPQIRALIPFVFTVCINAIVRYFRSANTYQIFPYYYYYFFYLLIISDVDQQYSMQL